MQYQIRSFVKNRIYHKNERWNTTEHILRDTNIWRYFNKSKGTKMCVSFQHYYFRMISVLQDISSSSVFSSIVNLSLESKKYLQKVPPKSTSKHAPPKVPPKMLNVIKIMLVKEQAKKIAESAHPCVRI